MTAAPMSIRVALNNATMRLRNAGIDDAGREARLLLAHVLKTDLTGLIAKGSGFQLSDDKEFFDLVACREAHEPLAYLVGVAGFWTLDLEVSRATLIPRADSETLIEALLHARPDRDVVRRVLDLGCGTGCLMLAILSEYPRARGIGIDLSPQACALAQRNAVRAGFADRVGIVAGRWAAAIEGQFDVVISNPPYIPSADIVSLMPEVALHEPNRALDGGADGLEAYRSLLEQMPMILAPEGIAIFEIGIDQGESVPGLVRDAGFEVLEVRPDLGGHARAVVFVHRARKNSTLHYEKWVGRLGCDV